MPSETVDVCSQEDVNAQKLRDWLTEKSKEARLVGLNDNLIQDGIIDSLQFMDFVLYVEELRGEAVPPEKFNMENFSSLAAILKNFF